MLSFAQLSPPFCRCYRRLVPCSVRTQMVYDFLEERQGLDLLRDKRVIAATADIAGIAVTKSEVEQTLFPINKMDLQLGLLSRTLEHRLVTRAVSRDDLSQQFVICRIDRPSSRRGAHHQPTYQYTILLFLCGIQSVTLCDLLQAPSIDAPRLTALS